MLGAIIGVWVGTLSPVDLAKGLCPRQELPHGILAKWLQSSPAPLDGGRAVVCDANLDLCAYPCGVLVLELPNGRGGILGLRRGVEVDCDVCSREGGERRSGSECMRHLPAR